ncbi:hypothetical protein EIN_185440 [Entamoeba invadens IP1]|uniref:hypothetical protein n=1 Tax=Entamoeba invadens IP1 TaxID=370355 RepID=UPI0002C3F12B|nr:hypothetical protein EIN_185440 [Entamoeba invadens IP1]ELP94157.1 hypothetical protein EIN_185440 [Entamoeba invadens IP1]|eukprot:XP_004260928.1 hypothetical protein EIN_185440 [Entamoeba invadens IP1]
MAKENEYIHTQMLTKGLVTYFDVMKECKIDENGALKALGCYKKNNEKINDWGFVMVENENGWKAETDASTPLLVSNKQNYDELLNSSIKDYFHTLNFVAIKEPKKEEKVQLKSSSVVSVKPIQPNELQKEVKKSENIEKKETKKSGSITSFFTAKAKKDVKKEAVTDGKKKQGSLDSFFKAKAAHKADTTSSTKSEASSKKNTKKRTLKGVDSDSDD